MAVTWTKEQQKVISLRNRNILVSAAAGSGKTAVLVQRILSKITDPAHPVDIDRLLIMTFTRAAAGEMRERISRALEQALYEDPENDHLQRQTTLIHGAQITTIDGFCAYIIRNYFHLIGLDPGYRTGDEGELKLLKEDVLANLLEKAYAAEDEQFLQFVECYAPGKSDDSLKEIVLKVYEAAMSHPDPEEWLEQCLKGYHTDTVEALRQETWMELLWKAVEEELEEGEALTQEGICRCLEPGGPYLYEETLESDLAFLSLLKSQTKKREYDAMAQLLEKPGFARLSGKKAADVEDAKKEQVKQLRDQVKSMVKELKERYFPCTETEILEMISCTRVSMECLVSLVRGFIREFGKKKREKNILDFTDMEHFALDILMEKEEDGKIRMSQAARELSEKYEEVLVDEYQDSNLVQELLTTCVSGWVNQRKNIFMVGDVKQSIYRFRLARPELFMEKYKTYGLEDGLEQRIDLHKNFRSRAQVLESVNYIFRQIMGEDLGGIQYDKAAALYPGASFPKGNDPEFSKTEILLVEKDLKDDTEEDLECNERELEALATAHRIRQIVGKELVLDKETGQYRPAEYGDIAVLLRSASGWAETFREVFASKGIPGYTPSRTGYFSAREVVTVLNLLKVCDNPLQDIPLTGVLYSPIVGCTEQELGLLRSKYQGGLLYESMEACLKGDPKELHIPEEVSLEKKLRKFSLLLDQMRDWACYMPVHQLIMEILDKTGYGQYAKAMPDGAQRSANLQMLVEKAMEYEKTSYRGLFNFIRYIESLQKYEVDFGEVNLSGAGQSFVQIMTIHKSKGLEFPIVFVAGMGKQFNFQDINARLLIHPELGFGADAILPEQRVIVPTLHKQIIRRELLRESLGEELRVLYVALTRAKEKLLLVGIVEKLEKQVQELSRYLERKEELLPVSVRMKAKNFWSLVLPALARHRAMDTLYEKYQIPESLKKEAEVFRQDPSEFVIRTIDVLSLTGEDVLAQTEVQMEEKILKEWDSSKVYEKEIQEKLKEKFSFSYPYKQLGEISAKVSVSELKKRNESLQEKEDAIFYEPDLLPLIPRFMEKEQEKSAGAFRGTAYHRVMECLDYKKVENLQQIRQQIKNLVDQGKLEVEAADLVRAEEVFAFVQSELGRRMKTAAEREELFREQPFVISRKAGEIDPKWPKEEQILVQGIMDAYFLEDGEIVLVDYKTDRVFSGQEDKLISLYKTQLEDYGEALERMLKKRVKEKIIYSFSLNRAVKVE